MVAVIHDLRYAARTLAAKPRLSGVIVLTLALGIGANTAVFSVVNAVLMRPLPYQDGDRLVWLWSTDPQNPAAKWVSYPDFLDLRAQSRTLESLASWFGYEMVLTGASEPERVQAIVVFGDLFGVLGTPPSLGTTFRAEKDHSRERAVVLSHSFWQRRFDSDPGIVGRGLTLSGQSFRVLGVMPEGFQFPIQTPLVDMWAALGSDQFADVPQVARSARGMEAIGRLWPDADLDRAQAELDVIASRLSRENPATNKDVGVRIVPAAEHVVGRVSRSLWVLFAAVGCVLLIACVNVANLLLARAEDRRREIALRSSLGASRAAIARQLAIESLLLAAAGGVAGGLLAAWGVEALVALVPGDLPRAGEIKVDGQALGFTVLASLMTGVAFGLTPAWRASKVDLTAALQEAGRTISDSARGRRLRDGLVVGEIALAMILLTGSALFTTSFFRLNQPPTGFDPHNVLTFEVTWPWERYSFAQAGEAFRQLQAKLLAVPGVRGAAVGVQLPDRGSAASDALFPYLEIEGRTVEAQRPRTASVLTQPGYFRTLGIPLLEGRDFDERDTSDAPRVVVVNESLARRFFPGEDPIGKRLKLDLWLVFGRETPLREIVGVVGDVKHRGLETALPLVYVPLAQQPFNLSLMVVKTEGDPAALVGAIRGAVRSVDNDQPIYDVQTLEQRMGVSLAQERFSALLLSTFSAAALALAAIGLYGVLSYNVSRRTHELGVRVALGAETGNLLGLVIGHGMKLILIGLIIGLIGALATMRLVEGLLFGVEPTDPLTLGLATVVLAIVAVLACWIPARRAASVNPIIALRYE